jgi:hypothetical protein
MQTTFKVETAYLKKSLDRFKKINPRYFKEGIGKIRVMPGGVELSTVGVVEAVHGETEGFCEVFVPLKLLYAYVSEYRQEYIKFTFKEGELECGSSTFSNSQIQISTWYSKVELELTINPSDIEILILGYKNFSDILQYNLYQRYTKAKLKLEQDITECYGILTKYGVKKCEIEEIIYSKYK